VEAGRRQPLAVGVERDGEDHVVVAGQRGEQLPVADLVDAQVALGRRLAAGDGEELAVGAEAHVVDGAEDVGELLHGLRRGGVPPRPPAVGAGGGEVAVGGEGDGGDRRQRADRQGQLERGRLGRAEQPGGGGGGGGQRHVELARPPRRGGNHRLGVSRLLPF